MIWLTAFPSHDQRKIYIAISQMELWWQSSFTTIIQSWLTCTTTHPLTPLPKRYRTGILSTIKSSESSPFAFPSLLLNSSLMPPLVLLNKYSTTCFSNFKDPKRREASLRMLLNELVQGLPRKKMRISDQFMKKRKKFRRTVNLRMSRLKKY